LSVFAATDFLIASRNCIPYSVFSYDNTV